MGNLILCPTLILLGSAILFAAARLVTSLENVGLGLAAGVMDGSVVEVIGLVTTGAVVAAETLGVGVVVGGLKPGGMATD